MGTHEINNLKGELHLKPKLGIHYLKSINMFFWEKMYRHPVVKLSEKLKNGIKISVGQAVC